MAIGRSSTSRLGAAGCRRLAREPGSALRELLWGAALLWLVGGERLLLPFFAVFVVLRRPQPRGRVPIEIQVLGLFLLLYALSFFMVRESHRYFTYLWDLSLYIGLFIVASAFAKWSARPGAASEVAILVSRFMLVVHLVGLTYFIFGPWSYRTPLGYLLPGQFLDSRVGSSLAVHSVGRELYFSPLTGWSIDTRLSSIFASSLQYSAATLLCLPLALYGVFCTTGRARAVLSASFVFGLVGLLFSQGRSAIVLGILSLPLLFYLLSGGKGGSKSLRSTRSTLVAACLAGILAVTLFATRLTEPLARLFLDTRAASAEQRFAVYRESIRLLGDSPLFGYGTQLDIDGIRFAAGTHSWYLAAMFRHGILAGAVLILFVALVVRSAWASAVGKRTSTPLSERRAALAFLFSVGCHAALSTAVEPIVDGVHILLVSVIYGTAIGLGTTFNHHMTDDVHDTDALRDSVVLRDGLRGPSSLREGRRGTR